MNEFLKFISLSFFLIIFKPWLWAQFISEELLQSLVKYSVWLTYMWLSCISGKHSYAVHIYIQMSEWIGECGCVPSQSDGSVLPSSWSDGNRLNLWCCPGAFWVLSSVTPKRKLCERETEILNCFANSSSLSDELEFSPSSP